MVILSINHVTTYRYRGPVGFGAHRMMLRPRDDENQQVVQTELSIVPNPRDVTWRRDRFGNHVAIARFAGQSDELCFMSTVSLTHAQTKFHSTDIEDYARTYPFRYRNKEWRRLKQFILPFSLRPELRGWTDQFIRAGGTTDTYFLLVEMTKRIHQTFRHVARYEKGIQDPVGTINLASGSCRDLAVLMIAALRSRGIATRFVSGYLHLDDEVQQQDDDPANGGNTHAWVQAYIPGPGWIDCDPSTGLVGNHNLIRVAVAEHPRDAIPLQGTWYGHPSDHAVMRVAVRVSIDAELYCDPFLNQKVERVSSGGL
jgi:transglutaminase-like putative cysteine protease